MSKPLLGHKIAFLVANGFNETDLVSSQKQLQALGVDTRIISMDQGLVSSLNENGWGLNFACDQALNESLAADYSGVVVPSGKRSIEKLQLTAHTRRFLRGFYESQKPVCILGDASNLLGFIDIDEAAAQSNLLLSENVDVAFDSFIQETILAEDALAA